MLENYSRLAKEYADSVNTKSYNAYYERPIMLDLVGEVAGLNVLELGCSTGWYSNKFYQAKAKVVAIDGNAEMIKYAKTLYPDISFICHDLNNEIKTEKKFDVIFASLVVHYITDLYRLYENLYRLLNEGGRLIISTHNPVVEYQRLTDDYIEIKKVTDEWNFSGKLYPVSYYTRSIQENLMPLIKAGFIIEKVLEPKPPKVLKEKDLRTYDKLSKKAGFLFLEARK